MTVLLYRLYYCTVVYVLLVLYVNLQCNIAVSFFYLCEISRLFKLFYRFSSVVSISCGCYKANTELPSVLV